MTLQEFLSDKDALTHQEALGAAKEYTLNQGRLLAATTVNSVLAELDLTADVKAISESQSHPARHKMASVILGIQGGEPFNFIAGDPQGERVLAMLDWVGANTPELELKWPLFKASVYNLSNRQVMPFTEVTLHDILVARDAVQNFKTLESPDGWVTIEVGTECEVHNPRLQAFNPHIEQWVPAGNFRGVGAVGKYVAQVPRNVFGWNLRVDDVYGALV